MSVRVPSTLLAVSALLLVAAPAAAAQAEPDPLPPGVIARVGEKDITKRSFDKWLKPAAHAQHGAGAVFDPPTYDRCIVRETRILSKKSETAPAREALLAQCKSRHETLIKQVAQFLIQAQWIEQAATAAKIRLTPKQVRRAFKAQKRRAFGTEKAFRRFLRKSGQVVAQVRYRIRLDLLQNRLMKRALEKNSLPRFMEEFRSSSKAKTTCAEGYVVDGCGTTVSVT